MSMMINPHRFGSGTPVAPTVRSANQAIQNTSGTSSAAVSSGSPVSGDLIILYMAHGQNLSSGTPIVWPSGFTEGGRSQPNRASGAWAWKVATGSEPSTYTVTWSTGNTRSILSCVVVKDQNGLDTAVVNSVGSNGNFPRSGSTTATTAPCLRLYFYSGGWGGGTLTVTPATTTPACSLTLAGAMTNSGNNTDGAGSFVIAKEETTTSLAQIDHTISWSGNGSGMHYTAFTIPVKRL